MITSLRSISLTPTGCTKAPTIKAISTHVTALPTCDSEWMEMKEQGISREPGPCYELLRLRKLMPRITWASRLRVANGYKEGWWCVCTCSYNMHRVLQAILDIMGPVREAQMPLLLVAYTTFWSIYGLWGSTSLNTTHVQHFYTVDKLYLLFSSNVFIQTCSLKLVTKCCLMIKFCELLRCCLNYWQKRHSCCFHSFFKN